MAGANSCPDPSTPMPAERRRKHSKKLRRLARTEFRYAAQRRWALHLMFEDEACFGRMTEPRLAWTPPGLRPPVTTRIEREYGYAKATLIPQDGALHTLVLPEAGCTLNW